MSFNNDSNRYFPKHISKDQAKDTGMAMVLICLLLGLYLKENVCYILSIILLLINMIVPVVYRKVAVVWLGFSHILGTIMSKVILSLIFFGVVVPVGILRKLSGSDSMKLKQWKKNNTSVFTSRDHEYHAEDIENPY